MFLLLTRSSLEILSLMRTALFNIFIFKSTMVVAKPNIKADSVTNVTITYIVMYYYIYSLKITSALGRSVTSHIL